MRKPSKGKPSRGPSRSTSKSTSKSTSNSTSKSSRASAASRAQVIEDFLRDGIEVTVGGVPIQITLGAARPAVQARPAAAKAAVKAAAAPKPRRKVRRRRSKRVLAPDMRDIRGHLATRMEGATLTALAQHFKVKRPLMKRMLKRMLDKQEITLFKGAFFNNKRLRQRRIASKYEPRVEARDEAEATPPAEPAPLVEGVVEQPTGPQAVPDPDPEEAQTPESLPYPERDAA